MRRVTTAEIVAVGSELLTPHRTDTNSLYLTARLNEAGIDVRAKHIVGDVIADLEAILRQALARADLVVLTGGLGPTSDDLTRDVVATVLDRPLEEDAELLRALEQRFASRGVAMPAINRKQAQVPRGGMILPNRNGTAPGIWLDVDGRIVVLLPGPPREMQPIFEHAVRPQLEARTGARGVRRRVIKMTGRAESQVEETAQPVYSVMAQWPVPIETTILASPGQIELHLSAREEDAAAADATLDRAVAALVDCLGDIVFSIDGRNLPEVVGDLLGERGYRIAVAESCTGGLVLGRLTDVPGSSAWVIGGVVAYSNDVKEAQLGVPAETLAQHGAVSEPVGEAMASGVRARLGADIGVAITGIAGPSGGSDAKPVGTVVIAADAPSGRRVRTFRFLGDRAMVRQQATQAALEMVRRLLLER